jgi:uncharacterized protein (DUF1800 family)
MVIPMPRNRCFVLLMVPVLALAAAPDGGRAGALSATLGPADLALIDRVTWGVNTSVASQYIALGRDRWLDDQLHPPPKDRLPAAAQAMINAMPIATKPVAEIAMALAAQSRTANQVGDIEQKKAAQQAYQQAMNDTARYAATRSLLRDLYSPDQLREKMTWFWFNHFNVLQWKSDIRATIGDYEERALRPYALGRFRDLLEATVKHPAMLRYLDNAENASGHINENYAREIMELHTMGVGSGYTQQDVQELARILTGVGVNFQPDAPKPAGPAPAPPPPGYIRAGLFEFNPNRHDTGPKHFLGHAIEGGGFAEVEQALDLLARQPATANHICLQIATYFVADTPPPALVQRMAQTFQRTDGDIASVLAMMFRSPEFNAAPKSKYKDPMQFVLSAVRLAYDDKVVLNPAPIQGWLGRLAQGLYNHETPDGYPMNAAAWSGPGQMAMRFEIARQIGANSAGLFKPPGPDAVDHPAFPQIQNALYFTSLQQTLGAPTRAALDQAVSPQDWNTLYLSSPEFMR